MNNVAVLVLNDFDNDSRVKKVVRSLSNKHKVQVYALGTDSSAKERLSTYGNSCTINRVVSYKRLAPGFRKKLNQLTAYLGFFASFVKDSRQFSVVHCNDLETLPIGIFSKIFNRKLKVVYDSHEYQTETLWMRNPVKKFLSKKFERALLAFSDKTIVVSDAIGIAYMNDYGIDKPSLILNCPNLVDVENNDKFRELLGIPKETTIFLYQGGFTEGRGIEILLESFDKSNREDICIVFMGYGPLETLIDDYVSRSNTIFRFPAVSPEVLLTFTSSADIGILFYEDNCLNHRYCSPNKMFEYTMAGLPVVTSNLQEMARLVKDNDIGVVASSNTAKGFSHAADEILNKDRSLLRQNVQEIKLTYSWETQEKALFEVYDEI